MVLLNYYFVIYFYVQDSKLVEITQPQQILMDQTLFKEFQIL